MGESLARQIAQRHPKRVVVMACDPASLQRDLPPFTAAGYVLHRVVPVDQFPKTAHVEAIAMLQYEPQAACS